MPLGKLDRTITIQSYSESKNDYGEATKIWSTYLTCFAEKVWGEVGNETIIDDQEMAYENITYRIRFNSGVTTKMRILDGSEYFNIRYIREEGRGKYMHLKTYRENG